MRRIKSIGDVVFEYGSLFIVEELSPKNKITETYIAADNSRIYYSATLLNAPLTLDSREYSWVTDDQRLSIIESYEADEELTVVFSDNYTATAKFALETPPTFQELSEGVCLYQVTIPMYYTSTPSLPFALTALKTATTSISAYIKVTAPVTVSADNGESFTTTLVGTIESFNFTLSDGVHTISFSDELNIQELYVSQTYGFIPQLPNNLKNLWADDGVTQGYSGSSFSANLILLDLTGSSIIPSELDSILAKLDAAGASNGIASLTGNSVPTNQAAITSLRAKGWQVNVDT